MKLHPDTDPEIVKKLTKINRDNLEKMNDFLTLVANSDSPQKYADAFKTVYGFENRSMNPETEEGKKAIEKIKEKLRGGANE